MHTLNPIYIKARKLYAITFLILVISSCNQKEDKTEQIQQQKISLEYTLLSNLPASKKPVQFFLKTIQAPHQRKVIPPIQHLLIDQGNRQILPEEAQGKSLFTNFTSDNGLALDQVHCSLKDRKGNLWFGTNGGGVSQYDGKKFTNYTNLHGLPSNVIWSIYEDNQSNIWFATDGNGVSKYDGKIFTNYSSIHGLAGDVAFVVKQDRKGNLWFGTSSGVSKYDGHIFKNYTTKDGLSSNAVKDILEDKDGQLWFATLGGGVNKFDGEKFNVFSTGTGLTSDTIRSIIQDEQGNFWFGTNGHGVCKYDGKKIISYTSQEGLASNKVMSLREDSKGNIWIGTNGGGISKFNGKQFINYSTNHGIESNKVPSITEDDHGNIWLSTFGGGVSKYGGNGFSNYTLKQGLPNNIIYSITEDVEGDLWLGTFGGGIGKYDRKSFSTYNLSQGLVSNNIYCTAKDSKGNLWFGTFESGLIKFDGTYFTHYTEQDGLAGNIIFSIKEDSKGNLWFGSSTGGVSKFDGKSFTNYTKTQGLASNGIFCITEDSKGNLWFGTYGNGVSKFDGEAFINFNTSHGLSNNTIWTIKEDTHQNIWFGTQEGLSFLSKEQADYLQQLSIKDTFLTHRVFETFSNSKGLPDNFVTQIVEDKDQVLYIGTNQGICELLSVKGKTHLINEWHVGKIFNTSTGYPIKDVNAGQDAMFLDSKGIIWIATGSEKSALVRFDPKAIKIKPPKPPALVIQNIKINNADPVWSNILMSKNGDTSSEANKSLKVEELKLFGRFLSEKERVERRSKFTNLSFGSIQNWYFTPHQLILPYDMNSIGFEFNAIETDKNFLVKYQYILEGYDKDWSPWSNKSTASFGNIDEGSYTFKVRAQTYDGVVSETLEYRFKVLPPWWRSWWMYLLYIVFFTSAIVFSFQWNNKRIIQQKKILEHKVVVATQQIREEKENVEIQKQIAEDTLKQLKDTQAQLIQSEKMASLGELTAGIAHEIQNPLNFVNNFSEISTELLEEMKQEIAIGSYEAVKDITSDLQKNLEKINYHGKRAGDIVKGMLQHSRSSTGQKELVSINKLCNEYYQLAYQGLRAKDKTFNTVFQAKFDENIGFIEVIPQDLGRVLLNLINNAFYAVNERKKIGEQDYEPMVYVETQKYENTISITVADNGMGIPEQIKTKIFQPFFTTKPTGEGTGLGLSLSYDIITKGHGGKLSVESESKKGAKFVIHLPIGNTNHS